MTERTEFDSPRHPIIYIVTKYQQRYTFRSAETRICADCDVEYEHYGQRQRRCKKCRRIYDNNWYAKQTDEKRKKIIKRKRNRRRRNVAFVQFYKARYGCIDCGYRDSVQALEFDHLPGTNKKKAISNLCSNGASLKTIFEEIQKCELVCANCHRIRTFNRQKNGM